MWKIRTGARVAKLSVRDGKVSGVVLDSGEEIAARAVAANVPPKLLFRDLVPEGAVAPELRAKFVGMRSGSGTFRMNVALAELPDFTCRPGKHAQDHHGAGIIIGPTLDYLERAYLDARTEGWSRAPVVEMLIPSTLDATLAPKGKHVASLFVQHVAPHLPDPRTWADEREKEAFADLVIETVNAHAPNFKAAVIARQVLSPLDLERRFGMVDGDIFHGALSLDQLFSARPLLGYANYRMPLPGSTCAGRARIRAAASPERRATMRRARSFAISRAGGRRWRCSRSPTPVRSTSASSRSASCARRDRAARTSTRSRPRSSCASTWQFALAAGGDARARHRLAGRRLTEDGILIIQADRFRTQERNRADARERLVELLARAAVAPKRRIPTRPTRAAKERRREVKVKRGRVKHLRGTPDLD